MAQDEESKLIREDFDAGPSSFDEIEPDLFLGNLTAATDVEWLKEINMTHVLTVDSCPLPRKIQERLPNLTVKYIQITDMPREDLLTHLEDSYEFIDQALKSNDALEIVKQKRHFVGPNPGFIAQLKLYEEMDFGIDNTNVQFKMYRLQIAADKVRKVKILPQNCIDLIKPDPALTTVRPEPTVYRCRKCRRIVASASNILPHTMHQRHIWRHVSSKRTPKQIKEGEEGAERVNVKKENEMTELCTKIYFVEPLAWMPDIMHNVEGKLNCPKCNTKLGSFSWIAGSQCPCGSKIAPAFYLVPSKVDWSNAVQNVQLKTRASLVSTNESCASARILWTKESTK
ncbi:dual specificity protein phosphatase MPK-4-like isoform X2 [Vespula pensylvanica]|uniref:dual specificity protein phosphatase MPK-4-like isoform X2 n=1 Tax=Vespula pensylvanica TaxID=30213 RepID=UPI001CB9E189|nr:dual specificity protein phosphatase MPK-4-like isoform X2 [Vespula pensylvanica]